MNLVNRLFRRDDGRVSRDDRATAEQIDEYVRLAGLIPQQGDAGRYKCGCGSANDVFVRPSYREPKYVEYALCHACLSRTVCCIAIGSVDAAPAPDMPSHLFPGCGSDGAEFTVTRGRKPSREEVSDMLYEAVLDSVVVEYDEMSGKGYFRVIDGEAPPVGAVIPLIAHAETEI
ncbi:hypothetical protein [Paraburkholderia fungorum]|uniref:Uncharacterized protein n=1 Tax=Paraburkholderia fungorum TaxID=134537 RepID=A0AAW3V0D4_9BURK|nr:hypothetical protein [Paraburkholderia fungorum]MBB4517200.1 hypothetical protein [Paraburkholderia fungorum]MBB6204268.1 hypothetical protein [Paraburkholderia fungorum]